MLSLPSTTTPSHDMSSISCPLSAIPPVPRSADFVARVSDRLSFGALAWSRPQLYSMTLFVCKFNTYGLESTRKSQRFGQKMKQGSLNDDKHLCTQWLLLTKPFSTTISLRLASYLFSITHQRLVMELIFHLPFAPSYCAHL